MDKATVESLEAVRELYFNEINNNKINIDNKIAVKPIIGKF